MPQTVTHSNGVSHRERSRLRAAREARGYTAQELAHRAGIGQGTVYRIENGHGTARRSTRILLAAVLGMRVEDLFTSADNALNEHDRAREPGRAKAVTAAEDAGYRP
jgi:transcriptional regulator with XRE-family HTH domain